MSALILPNPDNVPGAVTTGYQLQNTVLYASMTGMSNVAIDNINKIIIQGSIFELNGNIVRVIDNEIIGGSLSPNSICYVYAIPDNYGNVYFELSNINPEWSAIKGGWYKKNINNIFSNERALIKVVTNSSSDIVFSSGMNNEVNNYVPINDGGILVQSFNTKIHQTINVERGWYRYILTSGKGGGNGANGSNPTVDIGGNGGSGGIPSNINTISGVFFNIGSHIIIHVGGNGYNGNTGTRGTNGNTVYLPNDTYSSTAGGGGGGGGGGGAGEESYIISGDQRFATAIIPAGFGGAGGSGGQQSNNSNGTNGVNGADWPNSIYGYVYGGIGGTGGSGGANGSSRPIGDTNAGSCQIWRLS